MNAMTLSDIRQMLAVQELLTAQAERIIQTYFTVAQPGGYASDARAESISEVDHTVSIKYDWTYCGADDEHWKPFPLSFLFLNEADLQDQMWTFVREEADRLRREREAAVAKVKQNREATERKQLAALKAKYEQ